MKFPLSKFGVQNRSFSESYYNKFEWVEYSVSEDAIFCYACRIFGTGSVEPSFTSIGFRNWKKVSIL
ncbi:zinc finger MYM-type protein 5-like [Myzus persicae]|uniref:zinc finger MYM-type protein 5-like n=1 Tax=Myzus persicae TaxID=13164 RepID=UPI000B938187|nr:zinc finger MYM-type protein 5-like [Myzus persicae]